MKHIEKISLNLKTNPKLSPLLVAVWYSQQELEAIILMEELEKLMALELQGGRAGGTGRAGGFFKFA